MSSEKVKTTSLTGVFSGVLSWLRAVLCLCVVFIHLKTVNDSVRITGAVHAFFRGGAQIAVPGFFIISGYLFFLKGFSKDIYIAKVRRRFRSLVIPFYIWLFVGIVNWLIFDGGFTQLKSIPFLKSVSLFLGIWRPADAYCRTPINSPLWYVRDVFLLALVSPVIYVCLKRAAILFFLVIFALYFYFPITSETNLFLSLPRSSFWFSIGGCIALQGLRSRKCFVRPGRFSMVGTALLFLASTWLYELYGLTGITKKISSVLMIFSGVVFVGLFCWNAFLRWNVPRWVEAVSGASFFIYCLHKTVPSSVWVWLFRRFSGAGQQNAWITLMLMFAEWLFLWGISFLAYAVLKRIAPKVFSVLVGGREVKYAG